MFRLSLKIKAKDVYIGPSQFYDKPVLSYNSITRMHELASTPLELLEICGDQISERYFPALIQDYSQYVKDFGYTSVEQFMAGWTIMTRNDLGSLEENTTLYVQTGNNKFESHKPIIKDCVFSDEMGYMFMTTDPLNLQGHVINNSQEVLLEGDFYYIPFIHIDYLYKDPNQEKGEKLCPILITKTKEQ